MTDKFKALRDALARLPVGWDTAFNNAQTQSEGVVRIGATDEDGNFYDVMEIDTEKYYEAKAALPTAQYIVAANPGTIRALLAEVEALRQDKARLDWLEQWVRDTNRVTIGTDDLPPHQLFITSDCDPTTWSMTDLRAAIDATLRAKEESRG